MGSLRNVALRTIQNRRFRLFFGALIRDGKTAAASPEANKRTPRIVKPIESGTIRLALR
jgi:hypothetical protein